MTEYFGVFYEIWKKETKTKEELIFRSWDTDHAAACFSTFSGGMYASYPHSTKISRVVLYPGFHRRYFKDQYSISSYSAALSRVFPRCPKFLSSSVKEGIEFSGEKYGVEETFFYLSCIRMMDENPLAAKTLIALLNSEHPFFEENPKRAFVIAANWYLSDNNSVKCSSCYTNFYMASRWESIESVPLESGINNEWVYGHHFPKPGLPQSNTLLEFFNIENRWEKSKKMIQGSDFHSGGNYSRGYIDNLYSSRGWGDDQGPKTNSVKNVGQAIKFYKEYYNMPEGRK